VTVLVADEDVEPRCAVSVTWYLPLLAYVCVALVDVTRAEPSPKFQLYELAFVEVLAKTQERRAQL
jgi:hypothetical protein